jgi:class 3 adenylate cyclase/tetratricopeptide (TPR) repeat protein
VESIETNRSQTKFKACLLTGFFCLNFFLLLGQNQAVSDSLKTIYESSNLNYMEQLEMLQVIAENETDADQILVYSEKLVDLSIQENSNEYLFLGYFLKGDALRLKSELSDAMESYYKAKEIAEETNLSDVGAVSVAIADVYSIMGDHTNAVSFYKQGIQILKKEGDSINIASAQLNLGDEFFNQNELDSALFYFDASRKIFKELKSDIGIAYNLGNEGLVRAKKGEHERAESDLIEAIIVLDQLGDYYPICVYLDMISEIYTDQGEQELALEYALKSLELAQKYGLKEQIGDANLRLSIIYEVGGNIPESYRYYKNHINYKDSINSVRVVQEMANLRTTFEVSQKQIEVDLLNEQRKTQSLVVIAIAIALVLIILLAIGLFKRNKFIRKTNEIITHEKSLSDNLLRNILPEETALELKESGKVAAKKFESVSVLFTDFKRFSYYSESLSPENLVESIDYYFSKFDTIIEKYDLEKIKTIGDAYMCAGGLPFPAADHAKRTVHAAFDIIEFVNKTRNDSNLDITKFDIRLGINSGPVVAGVVGSKKFSYDIWGDTVNVASRIESNSEIGQINISESTYELIKDDFTCSYRGEIEVKNRGILKMYYVTGKIKETSE